MGVEVDAPAAAPAKTHAEEVHDHRVIGGLKAATHNPVRRSSLILADPTERVSEEAKEHARESTPRLFAMSLTRAELEAMGESV